MSLDVEARASAARFAMLVFLFQHGSHCGRSIALIAALRSRASRPHRPASWASVAKSSSLSAILARRATASAMGGNTATPRASRSGLAWAGGDPSPCRRLDASVLRISFVGTIDLASDGFIFSFSRRRRWRSAARARRWDVFPLDQASYFVMIMITNSRVDHRLPARLPHRADRLAVGSLPEIAAVVVGECPLAARELQAHGLASAQAHPS